MNNASMNMPDASRPPNDTRQGGTNPSQAAFPHWTGRRIAIVAVLWGLGAIAFAILSVLAHQYREFPGDLQVEESIQQIHQTVIVRIINFASDANWPTPAGIVAIAVVLALGFSRHFRAAIAAAVAGFGADFVNVVLNGLVKRPRPNDVHIHAVAHLGLYSFPSGHVTHAIAFYGFLLYLSVGAVRLYPAWRPALRIIQVICVYFLIFIGPSRVLQGEHWPSDVLGSYLLGALMLVVGIAIYHLLAVAHQRMQRRRSMRGGLGSSRDVAETTPASA